MLDTGCSMKPVHFPRYRLEGATQAPIKKQRRAESEGLRVEYTSYMTYWTYIIFFILTIILQGCVIEEVIYYN